MPCYKVYKLLLRFDLSTGSPKLRMVRNSGGFRFGGLRWMRTLRLIASFYALKDPLTVLQQSAVFVHRF